MYNPHMKKAALILALLAVIGVGTGIYLYTRPKPVLEEKFVVESEPASIVEEDEESAFEREILSKPVPVSYEIPKATHVYQTFNNCGPATLSMALSYFGINAGQGELGQKMRPYQNPKGDNDDKTIFTYEFASWAEKYGETVGLKVIDRPDGSIELLKKFISNDIPVVVKMWLNTKEDIGHFIIARGYDEDRQEIIKDDSYYGPDKRVGYYDFMSMWQSFNYSYIVLYGDSNADVVAEILGDEIDEKVAWKKAFDKAVEENKLVSDNIYPLYNMSVASYHLGNYEDSVRYFEQVESRLPRRMLWYQIEPIRAYVALEKYDRAFEIIDNILSDGNRAFSELYQIRGEIYLKQGLKDKARSEFETALMYNENFEAAKEALKEL